MLSILIASLVLTVIVRKSLNYLSKKNAIRELKTLAEQGWIAVAGAAEMAWKKSESEGMNSEQRTAFMIGALDEMVVTWYILLNEKHQNIVKKGSYNKYAFLADLRASCRDYVVTKHAANNIDLRKKEMHSSNLYENNPLNDFVMKGQSLIHEDLIINTKMKDEIFIIKNKISEESAICI
jgi:hypothetical protein